MTWRVCSSTQYYILWSDIAENDPRQRIKPVSIHLARSARHMGNHKREVKWALGSITTNKTSVGDGIPVELFQILEDDAVKVLHSICQRIWKTHQWPWKTHQWPQEWKSSVFILIPKKGNAKECSNYRTMTLILHASKVMLKILQARFQQYMKHELVQASSCF